MVSNVAGNLNNGFGVIRVVGLPPRIIAGDTGQMGDTGLEHNGKTPEKPSGPHHGGAESGAVLHSGSASLPPALAEIIAGWSRLPTGVQAGILAIVRNSDARAE